MKFLHDITYNNVNLFHGANPPIVNPHLVLFTDILNRIIDLKSELS